MCLGVCVCLCVCVCVCVSVSLSVCVMLRSSFTSHIHESGFSFILGSCECVRDSNQTRRWKREGDMPLLHLPILPFSLITTPSYIQTHTHTHTHTHIHTQTHTNTRTHTHAHARSQTGSNTGAKPASFLEYITFT